MKKFLSLLMVAAMVLSISVLTSGCGSTASPDNAVGSDGASSGEKTAADYKIVLILPGEVNDQGWNASNYAGLLACNEELGTNMEYVENVQSADFESTFREYAERGYDMVMAAGSQFDEAAATVAASYPSTMFVMVNGANCDLDNLSPLFPKEYEASYLAGIIAGNLSQTGKFAMIGGESNLAMEHLMSVYGKTAVSLCEGRGISGASYNLAYANSWSDVALGKQMAENMIDEGADVLFTYANELGLGAIDAAIDKGIKVVGYSSDQTTIDPNTVVASVDFDFATMYKWAINAYLDGELAGHMVHEVGINEGIFVPIYTDNISQETKDAVDAAIQDYQAGSVDLTALFDN
ncbi:BMP family protein [Oscillibacter sp.]|uniref:BMP family protein n=1 Tax=Oscillibacter sp. TaxID=1945593 RepID=UPI0028AB4530|nr:BMP family protein [Oscillibacter sp.]